MIDIRETKLISKIKQNNPETMIKAQNPITTDFARIGASSFDAPVTLQMVINPKTSNKSPKRSAKSGENVISIKAFPMRIAVIPPRIDPRKHTRI